MYQYIWDKETGGVLLTSALSGFSKEPRPVFHEELDLFGFDAYWNYPRSKAPLLWAEANNYIYRGKVVARLKGGSFSQRPEIVIVDNPEPDGSLLPVDVGAMVSKNQEIMEALEQETIQNIYNVYRAHKDKVDIYYVAFSGGKDSLVTLDLVQRALPHNEFVVVFGDTGMEFPDTYDAVRRTRHYCDSLGIAFETACSSKRPDETWRQFGPPSSVSRWCCSVHKTAPQVLLLRSKLHKPDFTGFAYVGVRGDESISRSKYDYVSFGEKHKGQYSCNAILDWGSAEIFLYLFRHDLFFNDAYRKGNRRVGCLVCPGSAERNDYLALTCYPSETKVLLNRIYEAYGSSFSSEASLSQFIDAGGWKARKNGRDLSLKIGYSEERLSNGDVEIRIHEPKMDWKAWIPTIGLLANSDSPFVIDFRGKLLRFAVEPSESETVVSIDALTAKENPEFVKVLKNIFRKASCCVMCRECEADCPYGNLSFGNGTVQVGDNCIHCMQCHKAPLGCLVYKSLAQPKGGIIMSGKNMSLNSYSHFAPKMEWMEQYFSFKNDFDSKHTLGSQMYSFFKRFLRDAKLLGKEGSAKKEGFTTTAEIIDRLGLNSEKAWGIIFVNLCYAPQVNWFVNHVNFEEDYSKAYLAALMVEDGAKDTWTNDIFSSLTRLTELPLGDLGLGNAYRDGSRASGIRRTAWGNPDPLVILYALYKFSDACGSINQFTLSSLCDESIERDGVSPTVIFGISKLDLKRLLNGLSVNYPDFISVSFTLDLDSITLQPDHSPADVLALF